MHRKVLTSIRVDEVVIMVASLRLGIVLVGVGGRHGLMAGCAW